MENKSMKDANNNAKEEEKSSNNEVITIGF